MIERSWRNLLERNRVYKLIAKQFFKILFYIESKSKEKMITKLHTFRKIKKFQSLIQWDGCVWSTMTDDGKVQTRFIIAASFICVWFIFRTHTMTHTRQEKHKLAETLHGQEIKAKCFHKNQIESWTISCNYINLPSWSQPIKQDLKTFRWSVRGIVNLEIKVKEIKILIFFFINWEWFSYQLKLHFFDKLLRYFILTTYIYLMWSHSSCYLT